MEHAFAEFLRRAHRDYRVLVFAHELAPDLRPLVDWKRIRVPRRPIPLKFALFFLVAGVRLARARADLVHVMGAIVPNRADVVSVHHCHRAFLSATGSLSPRGMPPLRRLNTAVMRMLSILAERWCYRRGHAGVLAAVSSGLEKELRVHFPTVSVSLTPNGVDASRFSPDAKLRASTRAQHCVPADAVVALFVGGDWDHKGLALIIDGVAHARRRTTTPVHLWVVGRGNAARFRSLADRHGMENDVRFLGEARDPSPFYAAADLFVLASVYETFSLAAYEAAAAGLPVVSTHVSGIDDLVGTDAGFLVNANVAALGDAFVKLAADAELRVRMGAAARRRSRQYTWDRATQATLDVYRSVLTSRPLGADGGL
jgi:glycosyltransferase involved in cell wall biosynthesis